VKLEIISFIAEMYFTLPEPRPFLSVQFSKNSDGLRALSVLSGDVRSQAAKFHVRDLARIGMILPMADWGPEKPILRVQFFLQRAFENWLRR